MSPSEKSAGPQNSPDTVRLEELAEYAICPLRHFYRYRLGVDPGCRDEGEAHRVCLRQAYIWLYGRLSATLEVRLQDLFRTFEESLVDRMEASGLGSEPNPNLLASSRLKLKRVFDDSPRGLLAVGAQVPFEREFRSGERRVTFQGTIDLLRVRNDHRPKERALEIVQFWTEPRLPGPNERRRIVPLIGAKLGTRNYGNFSRGRPARARVLLHSIHQDHEVEVVLSEDDLKGSLHWLLDLAEAVRRPLYYPQQSVRLCGVCPYQGRCNPRDPRTQVTPPGPQNV